MKDAPTIEQARELAAAVVHKALVDLESHGHDAVATRRSAVRFLRVDMWTGETPWADLLGLTRERFLAAIAERLKSCELRLAA